MGIISEKARAGLLRLIRQGKFNATNMLPSEQALAEMLGISRTPLRVAIEELIAEGIIQRNGKRGCFLLGKGVKLASPMRDSIVFISDYIADQRSFNRCYPGDIQAGLFASALSKGYNYFVIQNVKNLSPSSSVNWFLGNPPLAVIPSNYISHNKNNVPALIKLKNAGIHVIASGNPPFLSEFNRVAANQEKGAYILTTHFIARGCRDIRMLYLPQDKEVYWLQERARGYQQAMKEAGLGSGKFFPEHSVKSRPKENTDLDSYLSWLAGVIATTIMNEGLPEAILVYSDSYCPTIGMAFDIIEKGIATRPLIGGFDGYWSEIETEENAKYKPVATVDTKPHKQGAMMIEMLEEAIAGELQEPTVRFCEPELVILDE